MKVSARSCVFAVRSYRVLDSRTSRRTERTLNENKTETAKEKA